MKHKSLNIALLLFVAVVLVACRGQYEMTDVVRSRILIDKRYDKPLDKDLEQFIMPYKAKVDSVMAPIVGQTAHYMYVDLPESPLSNLMPDILMWAANKCSVTADFAIYNVGGIRASLAEGDVTLGDIYAVAPFENLLCFVSLSGHYVKQLFEQIAEQKGQAVSREVKMRIGKDGTLKEVLISGKPIDETRYYTIATIDYVAEGNDGMTAFKHLKDKHLNANVRDVIIEYFVEKNKQGEKVSQEIEGRITIE